MHWTTVCQSGQDHGAHVGAIKIPARVSTFRRTSRRGFRVFAAAAHVTRLVGHCCFDFPRDGFSCQLKVWRVGDFGMTNAKKRPSLKMRNNVPIVGFGRGGSWPSPPGPPNFNVDAKSVVNFFADAWLCGASTRQQH